MDVKLLHPLDYAALTVNYTWEASMKGFPTWLLLITVCMM